MVMKRPTPKHRAPATLMRKRTIRKRNVFHHPCDLVKDIISIESARDVKIPVSRSSSQMKMMGANANATDR